MKKVGVHEGEGEGEFPPYHFFSPLPGSIMKNRYYLVVVPKIQEKAFLALRKKAFASSMVWL